MRTLASIQEVLEIKPIENADSIELACVLGWQAVVKKGDFQPGDLAVFFEIDSLLPEEEPFLFLSNYNYRIKTQKLRGVYSQGLLMPINSFKSLDTYKSPASSIQLIPGFDVTELLGVKKYEKPEVGEGRPKVKGSFPHFIPKTDESRLQSNLSLLKELKGLPYYISQKCDGTSFTAYWDKEENCLSICTRNNKLREDSTGTWKHFWDCANEMKLSQKLEDLYNNGIHIALQGELVGPKIQGNAMGLNNYQVFFFNTWDITNRKFLNFPEFERTIKHLGLNTVKILEVEDSFYYNLPELLEKAEHNYDCGKLAEGIVIRPQTEMYSETLKGRLSFKVISRKFLLKESL